MRAPRLILLLLAAASLGAQTPLHERVLVVYNSGVADSLLVAQHYLAQRHIPEANLCKISPSSPDYLKLNEYEKRVKEPLRKCIEAVGKQKILYIVFSYQTPYDVFVGERGFALDSYVADLWDEYSPSRPGNETGAHPYFGDAESQGNVYGASVPLAVYRDQPRAMNLYSVWRLDAATADLAKGLVDKAIYAEAHGLTGKGCFDLQSGISESVADYSASTGDWDIHQSAEFARRAGFEVVEDATRAEFGTAPAPLRCDGAALYAGWYSLGHYNDAFTWNPGAIGLHLDSASAQNPRGGTNWAANAVMKGITITSGAAGEPYLEGLAHPDQVFLYLFQGANAGDALLRSTRWLKWMILNIGDPLYRPFPKGIASNPKLPPESMLALLPQEMMGGDPASGIAAISTAAAEGGTVVALSSSRPDVASVPKNVTIPAKANSARFPILTHAVGEDSVPVQISMAAGNIRRTNTLVVHACMQPLALSSPKAAGGAEVTAIVTLNRAAPAEGVTVKLKSDKPALAAVPAEVKVQPGATTTTFTISTKPAKTPDSASITVSAGGCSRSAVLAVTK